MLLCSFAPAFVPLSAQADVTPQGAECKITSGSQISMTMAADRTVVKGDEKFNVQIVLAFKDSAVDIAKACEANGKSNYSFQLYAYNEAQQTYTAGINIPGTFFSPTATGATEYGYGFRQSGISLSALGACSFDQGVCQPSDGNYYLYAYLWDRVTGKYSNIYTPASPGLKIVQSATASETPTALPDLPKGVLPGTGDPAGGDADTISFDKIDFGVSIKDSPNSTNDAHRNFFRISPSDQSIAVPDSANAGKHKVISFSAFDAAGGIPVAVTLGPNSTTSGLRVGANGSYISYHTVVANSFPTLGYFFNATHRINEFTLVNIEANAQKDKAICAVSVFSSTQFSCYANKSKEIKSTATLLSKAQAQDVAIKLLTGTSLDAIGIKGAPEAIVTMNVMPTLNTAFDWTQIIGAASGSIFVDGGNGVYTALGPKGFSYGKSPQTVVFQIYANKDELAKHMDDAVPASVPAYKDVVTSNTQSGGPATVGQTLYAFIVRVISDIIVFLQSVIYFIFATILVPILNALLRVHPYEDAFVNIIYPGWLILRNLANIFFIVSLLVVGLRILFQQSAAGTARSFILRLVIMALLVNFSLVIAQGLVGIADTVQSQFLPGNTKIIEALGQKLMVEPLKQFRAEVTNSNDNGLFSSSTADVGLADTIKPIVLLILSIAAFFSFIALAAFLLVRLVALWVLYMLSPIAYVGYVMDETKKYAGQWWAEFLKYAIVTPVLVFFLNIAALMASVLPAQNNTLFKYFSNSSLSQDIVTGALTVISQFIVLFFIYAGMKFAMSSGTAGAKTIVDYSKKGFDWTTQTAPKAIGTWAKDSGSDALASTDFAKKRPNLEKAIRTVARPVEAGKAFKKGYFDIPKERMNGRFTDSFGQLTRTGLKYGNEKTLPVKMAWWKMAGKDAETIRAKAAALDTEMGFMTGEERSKMPKDLKKTYNLENDDLSGYAKGRLGVKEGVKIVEKMDKDLGDIIKNAKDLEDKIVDRKTSTGQKAVYQKEKDELEVQAEKLHNNREALQKELDTAHARGEEDIDAEGIKVELQPYYDVDTVRSAIESMAKELEEDRKIKKEFGIADPEKWTDKDRKEIKHQQDELYELAAKRDWPDSPADRADAASRQKKAGEAWEDIDDRDALIKGFKQALEDNNVDQAAFISKKLAKAGLLDGLLEEMGHMNNADGFAQFMQEFKGMTKAEKGNLGMQLSSLSAANGNKALGSTVNVSGPKGRNFKSLNRQQRDNASTSNKKKIFDMGKGDFAYQVDNRIDGEYPIDPVTGKEIKEYKSNRGVIEHLNTYNSEEGIKTIKKLMSADKAKFVLDMKDSHLIAEPVRKALQEAMGKGNVGKK